MEIEFTGPTLTLKRVVNVEMFYFVGTLEIVKGKQQNKSIKQIFYLSLFLNNMTKLKLSEIRLSAAFPIQWPGIY